MADDIDLVGGMTRYSVKPNDSGGYGVLVTKSDSAIGYTAITFATRSRAENWIKTRLEIDKAAGTPP